MERIFWSGRALLFGPAHTAATNVANAAMSRPIGMRVPTSSHYPSFRMENPVGSVDRVDHRPHHQTEIQCPCPSADQELRPYRRSSRNVSIRVIFMQLSTSIRSTFREGLRRLDAP